MAANTRDAGAGSTIGAQVAARLIMITPRRLQQLVTEGWIPRAEKGRYTVVGVVQGYLRFLHDEARRTTRSAADSRVAEARAAEIEQRIAIRDKRLIEITEHDAVFDEAFGMLKAELIGLGARVSREKGKHSVWAAGGANFVW